MSIRYECEQCGSVLKIKNDLAGKPGKCPKCKTAFTVPAPDGEADSSGEIAATGTSDDAEPMLATTKSGSANEDFDLDAFLLDDDGAKPKTVKTGSSKPRQEDERSDETDSGADGQAKKAKKDQEGEGFSIRRGPDAPDKRPKHTSVPGQGDEEVDEPSIPSRRPPGTNPNAPASNIASDLLSKSAKKGKKASWNEVGPEKREEDQYDWEGMRREVLKKFLPIVIGGVVLCWGLFKLVNSSMGSRTFVPPLGQVTGTLTINAKPLVGAEVWFHPENKTIEKDGKKHQVTSSMGITDATGRYELTYIGDSKGAVVGTCRVQITAAGRQDVASQYLGSKATATQTVKKGKQIIDLELSK
ncbi:MAG: hypothetical protein IAG10_13720 [Planctomycetaceae bacterium]|nr:hypothetical protein [Planctomycetaceae bacterium]